MWWYLEHALDVTPGRCVERLPSQGQKRQGVRRAHDLQVRRDPFTA